MAPKLNTETLDKDLALTPTEVCDLWASIADAVDPGYFNSATWYKAGTQTQRTIHDYLRQASLRLVFKFISQLTTGPPNSRNISAGARFRFLSDMADRSDASLNWPRPPPDMPTAADHAAWEIRPLHYFTGFNSAGFLAVSRRLAPPDDPTPPQAERSKTPAPAPPAAFKTPTKTQGSPTNEERFESILVTPKTSPRVPAPAAPPTSLRPEQAVVVVGEATSPEDLEECPMNATRCQSSSPTDGTDNGAVEELSSRRDVTADASFADDEPGYDSEGDGLGVGSSSSALVDDPFEEDHCSRAGTVYYLHPETGQYLPKPTINRDEDMGPSIDLEIAGDEVLVTDDMLARARALCDDEADADLTAVAAVAQHEMAWEDITRRGIRQASLSGIGLASLAIEHLANLGHKIDENLIYWKRREAVVAAMTKKLIDEQARVAQDAAILASLKGSVILQSHQLAEEQQKAFAANQRNVYNATSGAPILSAHDHRGVGKLRQKMFDTKRRTNQPIGRPVVTGFSGVRPVSGSATSLSPNYLSNPSAVSTSPTKTTPSRLAGSHFGSLSGRGSTMRDQFQLD